MKIGNFESLYLKKEIVSVNKYGIQIKEKYLNLKYLQNNKKKSCIAFSIKKKIGIAVIRNKIKRRIKAVLHEISFDKNNYNIVIIAKPGILEYSFIEIKNEVLKLCAKIHNKHNS